MYQLALSRMREFYREPEAVFWVFGFPIVLAFARLAFRNTGPGQLQVAWSRPGDSAVAAVLDWSPAAATVLDTATRVSAADRPGRVGRDSW